MGRRNGSYYSLSPNLNGYNYGIALIEKNQAFRRSEVRD
ncbi:hypothetical protein RintRC_7770 [Richelia intracellularis]|nr:hypothetical protein RintRC_7770 [Richelia intracellularis]